MEVYNCRLGQSAVRIRVTRCQHLSSAKLLLDIFQQPEPTHRVKTLRSLSRLPALTAKATGAGRRDGA